MISRKREYLVLGSSERLCDWKFFCSTLSLRILMFQLFPSISHLICRNRFAVYLSLLTTSILCLSNFVKLLATARKSLRGFRKFSIRFTMTRPWRERRYTVSIDWRRSRRKSGNGGSEKSYRKGFRCRCHRRSGEWPGRECQETHSCP